MVSKDDTVWVQIETEEKFEFDDEEIIDTRNNETIAKDETINLQKFNNEKGEVIKMVGTDGVIVELDHFENEEGEPLALGLELKEISTFNPN